MFHNLIMRITDKRGEIIMDQKPKNMNNRHEDPFHLFMFGDRGREANAEIENDQRHSKDTEKYSDTSNRSARKEDWILGKRNHHSSEESSQHKYPQIDELLNRVNVDELMNNIDDLFTSISQIKPLWKKFDPVIKKWMKH